MELDLSIGLMPTPPGFIGPMDAAVRMGDGAGAMPIVGPIGALPGLEPGMRPLLIRFDDDDGVVEVSCGRGLNPGWPCEETRNGPEF